MTIFSVTKRIIFIRLQFCQIKGGELEIKSTFAAHSYMTVTYGRICYNHILFVSRLARVFCELGSVIHATELWRARSISKVDRDSTWWPS